MTGARAELQGFKDLHIIYSFELMQMQLGRLSGILNFFLYDFTGLGGAAGFALTHEGFASRLQQSVCEC